MSKRTFLFMKSVALLIPFALVFFACNQQCPNSGRHGKGHEVTAYGYGAIKAVPDVAEWTIEAEFTRPTMGEAVAETQNVMNEALKACAKAIPDSNDIRTARIYTRREYAWQDNKNVFKGYAASQTIEIKLRDFSRMESLTDELLEAGITAMNGPAFSHSKTDSLRGEAAALAMADAKRNAGKMCRAVNLDCDELVMAKASPSPEPGMPMAYQGFADMKMARAEGAGVSVKPGVLAFSSTIEATYRGE